MKILTELRTLALGLEPVGSRVTRDPPVLNTDEDYLVLVAPEAMPDVHMALLRAEFALDGSNITDAVSTVPEEDRFQSFSNDTVNIILTRSPKFFRRFMAATYVARRLNLRVKGDRIALFQAVLYGNADSGGGHAPCWAAGRPMAERLWAGGLWIIVLTTTAILLRVYT